MQEKTDRIASVGNNLMNVTIHFFILSIFKHFLCFFNKTLNIFNRIVALW